MGTTEEAETVAADDDGQLNDITNELVSSRKKTQKAIERTVGVSMSRR